MCCAYVLPDPQTEALRLAFLCQILIDPLLEFVERGTDVPADRIEEFRQFLEEDKIDGRTMSYEKFWLRDHQIPEATRAEVLDLLQNLGGLNANRLLDTLMGWQRGFLWYSQTLEHIPPPLGLSKLCTPLSPNSASR